MEFNQTLQADSYEGHPIKNETLYLRSLCLDVPISLYHTMKHANTLHTQYRHIDHMHEAVWLKT